MRLFLFLLFLPFFGISQTSDEQLLQVYLTRGEYDKATPYAERIYERNPNKTNFLRYHECLIAIQDYKTAEKELKRQVNANRYDYDFPLLLGELYTNQGEENKAQKIYANIIDDLPPSANSVIQAYNAFRSKNLNDFALQTLQKGDKLLRGTYPLQLQYADYYGAIGNTEKMLDTYVELLGAYPNYMSYVETMLARKIDFSEEDSKPYEYLKNRLLSQLQKKPDDVMSAQLLIWLFIQRKQFSAALVQVQALDKRQNSMGAQVYELGRIALENKAYAPAKNAFQYVVQLGGQSPYAVQAEMSLLNSSYLQITEERNIDSANLAQTLSAYKKTIDRFQSNARSAPLIQELAHLEAFFANQPDSAILRLNRALEAPGLTDMTKAELKMELADIQVLSEDIWNASLLYMQIDKDFKYETIGEEAKFKNARIFYFDGEFDFAQSQLDILKQATSKLIANDAMRLSLLITENYGLDSNYEAMLWFAKGDLLIEQQQYALALTYFDSISSKYNYSPLGDEILLKKGEAAERQGRWNEALMHYQTLLKDYTFDLLADDALFKMGDIYQFHLADNEKAVECYRQILFDYKGSLHTSEARKRFRELRGDNREDLRP